MTAYNKVTGFDRKPYSEPDLPKGPPGGGDEKPGGGGGGMEDRVRKLEDAMIEVKTILPTLATKADVMTLASEFHRELLANTWRIIGACTLLVGAVFTIAKYVH